MKALECCRQWLQHKCSSFQLLHETESFSQEATATDQRFLHQNDLIFQSIKSVLSTRDDTTIALHLTENKQAHCGKIILCIYVYARCI